MKKYDVFISYRRSGGFESASLIAEKLRGMGYSVFFDVESLRSGKFNEQLYHVIEKCRDFVVVLPENALDRCSNADGSANEEDWIRKELLHAIDYKKNIIPVMLAGFEWPHKMPVGLESLKEYQSITATSHETFDLAMQRLAGYCDSRPHKFKFLKILTSCVAVIVLVVVLVYFLLLQIAIPVCTSVANEYSVGMELVHELCGEVEDLKSDWESFLSSYHSALSNSRKMTLEEDILNILQHKLAESENIRTKIRPAIDLSEWQTMLLGLYGSQKEDVEALPMFVSSYVDDMDSLVSVMRRVVLEHKYRPSELCNVSQSFQIYEHSVNIMYYSYLQELTLLPEGCRMTHDGLSKSWHLLPTTSLTLPQEEYARLVQVEVGKMEELLHKMEHYTNFRDNESYDIEQRLDTLESQANMIEAKLK